VPATTSSATRSTGSSTDAPPIRATVYAGRWPNIPAVEFPGIPNGTFSPTTSALITGATEAVLIDAQYLKDDVRDLGDLIERTGKKLTTIYITHAHQDHYVGFGPLLERFPGAKCVALPHVVEAIKESMDMQTEQWKLLFGDACVTAGPVPEPMEGHTLYVDGSPLNIIEVKQADIHPTTIVHVPEIDVVVAGDSIYNEIHAMLGFATPAEWQDWLETVDIVEGLKPRMIVAGHRRPDGDDYAVDRMIAQTRSYIKDFAATCQVSVPRQPLDPAVLCHGRDDAPRQRCVTRGYHGLTRRGLDEIDGQLSARRLTATPG
jgi:glyoxylase-like metal-dependent hydrolase (beta-lactamase superfamily II)